MTDYTLKVGDIVTSTLLVGEWQVWRTWDIGFPYAEAEVVLPSAPAANPWARATVRVDTLTKVEPEPEPLFEFEPGSTTESKVYQAIGAASMCWTETPGGVFLSERAKQIGDAVFALISDSPSAEVEPEPGMGHAGNWQKMDDPYKLEPEPRPPEPPEGSVVLCGTRAYQRFGTVWKATGSKHNPHRWSDIAADAVPLVAVKPSQVVVERRWVMEAEQHGIGCVHTLGAWPAHLRAALDSDGGA